MFKKVFQAMLMVILLGSVIGGHASALDVEERYLWEIVCADDEAVVYGGMWLDQKNVFAQCESEFLAFRESSYAEFSFDGSAIRWIGSLGMGRGEANVYLNNELVAEKIDLYNPVTLRNQIIFELRDLKEGNNQIKIVPTNTRSAHAFMSHVAIEGFSYVPSLRASIEGAQNIVNNAQPPKIGRRLLPYYLPEDISHIIDAVKEATAKQDGAQSDFELNKALLVGLRKNSENVPTRNPVFKDNSMAQNHAIVFGGPLWLAGQGGPELSFDDFTSQYVYSLKTGALDGASSAEMEIEVFLDKDFWNSQHGLIGGIHDGSGSTSNQQFTFTRHSNNTMQFRLNTTGRHEVNTVMSPGEYDGKWITLKARFEKGFVTVFVDDELKFDYSANAETLFSLNQPFFLSTASASYDVGSRGFIGKIRKARLAVDGEDVLNWTFDVLEFD